MGMEQQLPMQLIRQDTVQSLNECLASLSTLEWLEIARKIGAARCEH